MNSEIDVDRGALEEQPLSSNEKTLLSEYFQIEGRRRFENYRSIQRFKQGRPPSLSEMMNMPIETAQKLSDKKFSLELSQRDHWVDMIESIHRRFYERSPSPPEIMLWTSISLEKHALVQIKTGQDEYKNLLQHAHQRQLQLIGRLGELTAKQFNRNQDLFYDLLDIDGLSQNIIGVY